MGYTIVARFTVYIKECHECQFFKIKKDEFDGLDKYICDKGGFANKQGDVWVDETTEKPIGIPSLCPYQFKQDEP